MTAHDIWLCDDGTLDTVVEYTCPECGETHELRYDSEIRFQYDTVREFIADAVLSDIESDGCPNAG